MTWLCLQIVAAPSGYFHVTQVRKVDTEFQGIHKILSSLLVVEYTPSSQDSVS